MAALPEGYIATASRVGEAFGTYAVDSAVLARVGELHTVGNQVGLELDLNGDSRLERIKEYARELKRKYAERTSRDYIPNVQTRERTITDLLMEKIHEAYGSYSYETLRDRWNVGERQAQGILWDSTPRLRDMERGSLVCRHYAAVMSVALQEGGVSNHYVVSPVNAIYCPGSEYRLTTRPDNLFRGNHSYVVTEGGAIVEATRAGRPESAYEPIVNGVGIMNIIHHGRGAVVRTGIYGGGTGNGDTTSTRFITARQQSELDILNEQSAFPRAVEIYDPNERARKVRELLNNNLPPATYDMPDANGVTPLLNLSWRNTSEDGANILRLLNVPGIRVNVKDTFGYTALHWAAEYGRMEAARLLIEKGADIGAVNGHGETILHRAVSGNQMEMTRLLLDHGVDINARNVNGSTALGYAIVGRKADIARLLIEKGAIVDEQDRAALSALIPPAPAEPTAVTAPPGTSENVISRFTANGERIDLAGLARAIDEQRSGQLSYQNYDGTRAPILLDGQPATLARINAIPGLNQALRAEFARGRTEALQELDNNTGGGYSNADEQYYSRAVSAFVGATGVLGANPARGQQPTPAVPVPPVVPPAPATPAPQLPAPQSGLGNWLGDIFQAVRAFFSGSSTAASNTSPPVPAPLMTSRNDAASGFGNLGNLPTPLVLNGRGGQNQTTIV